MLFQKFYYISFLNSFKKGKILSTISEIEVNVFSKIKPFTLKFEPLAIENIATAPPKDLP